MSTLQAAIAAGFRNVAWLKTDQDFSSLRTNDDFRLLLMDVAFPPAFISPD
jgi:hypothetical protein